MPRAAGIGRHGQWVATAPSAMGQERKSASSMQFGKGQEAQIGVDQTGRNLHFISCGASHHAITLMRQINFPEAIEEGRRKRHRFRAAWLLFHRAIGLHSWAQVVERTFGLILKLHASYRKVGWRRKENE